VEKELMDRLNTKEGEGKEEEETNRREYLMVMA
jgi:hypothetical protein